VWRRAPSVSRQSYESYAAQSRSSEFLHPRCLSGGELSCVGFCLALVIALLVEAVLAQRFVFVPDNSSITLITLSFSSYYQLARHPHLRRQSAAAQNPGVPGHRRGEPHPGKMPSRQGARPPPVEGTGIGLIGLIGGAGSAVFGPSVSREIRPARLAEAGLRQWVAGS
jgi:hypothetical protein